MLEVVPVEMTISHTFAPLIRARWRSRGDVRCAHLDRSAAWHTLIPVRTTIILDDELGHRLRREAERRGQSFSAFLAEAGRAALGRRSAPKVPAFELIIEDGEGVRPGIDLDRIGALQAAEDERVFGR